MANNNAGLGFHGYDEKTNQPKWDLVDNARILNVEVCKLNKFIYF